MRAFRVAVTSASTPIVTSSATTGAFTTGANLYQPLKVRIQIPAAHNRVCFHGSQIASTSGFHLGNIAQSPGGMELSMVQGEALFANTSAAITSTVMVMVNLT